MKGATLVLSRILPLIKLHKAPVEQLSRKFASFGVFLQDAFQRGEDVRDADLACAFHRERERNGRWMGASGYLKILISWCLRLISGTAN